MITQTIQCDRCKIESSDPKASKLAFFDLHVYYRMTGEIKPNVSIEQRGTVQYCSECIKLLKLPIDTSVPK